MCLRVFLSGFTAARAMLNGIFLGASFDVSWCGWKNSRIVDLSFVMNGLMSRDFRSSTRTIS